MPIVSEMLFDLELATTKPSDTPNQSVLITGLARAGTTILMRSLYESGEFASLTYKDMPCVLAPNFWNKVSIGQKARKKEERAHGDGIQVDFDSPEALEEIFWLLKAKKDYLRADGLYPHTVGADDIKAYFQLQNLVCTKYEKARYLAKNNNHILRLESLAQSTEEMQILILFRSPDQQAKSLLTQHQRFAESDPFTQKYMKWLGHYEFGATHRPFHLGEFQEGHHPDEEEYWWKRWTEAYAYLAKILQNGSAHLIPVSYERLCNETGYWEKLCARLNLPRPPSSFRKTSQNRLPTQDHEIRSKAYEIYDDLDHLSRQRIR